MTRPRLAMLVLAAAVVVIACVETLSTIGPGHVAGLLLQTDSLDVRVGRQTRLRAFPVDETGVFRPDVAIEWSSDTPEIVAVNDSGVASGVAVGVATVTAQAEGFEAGIRVRVEPAPRLSVTRDSVAFAAQAGDPDPGPDSVEVENAGGFVLAGLTVDTIVYGAGAADWLLAQLSSTAAPATLTLSPMVAGVTTAGAYLATVEVSAVDAEGSPIPVTVSLTIGAADPSQVSAVEGDAQTAAVNTTVATAPAVLVEDAFGNPVSGAPVMFQVTGGGGAVTGGAATSDAAGIARVGGWQLGTMAGANTLSATVTGAPAVGAVTFTATATPGDATQVGVGDGDNQSAVAGTMVPTPPAVVVRDQFGNGVPGVTVTFAVTLGGGSITGATPTTGTTGMAAVGSWTLGTEAGPNTLTATVAGLSGSPVPFTATGLSGEAVNLVLEAGDMQTDTVAATLATAYAVKVTDQNGNGVEGVPVSWSVTGGTGGSITMSSTTDVDGIATATRVLGTIAGPQTAQAAVGGLDGSPVAFTATALPGAAVSIAASAGNGQSATVNTAVAVDPAVIVRDQFTNPVPGHSVTFAVTGGGGMVNPTSDLTTGVNGVATVTSWTLGTGAGTNNNTLEATAAGGLAGSPVVFTASGTADAAANIAMAAGNGQTAVSGIAVPTDPAVTVTDQYGNPVGGATVTFAVVAGGGSVTGETPTTNASGVAVVGSWIVRASGPGDAQGRTSNTLRASINAGAAFVDFSAFSIFSYAAHVHPKWSQGCNGCHGGLSGLTLTPDAASSYAALVDVNPVCDSDGTLVPQGYRRVATGGGATAESRSILLIMIDPPTPLVGMCDRYMPDNSSDPASNGMSQGVRDTVRAWIRNAAPNN